jgi:hypothetical protein
VKRDEDKQRKKQGQEKRKSDKKLEGRSGKN